MRTISKYSLLCGTMLAVLTALPNNVSAQGVPTKVNGQGTPGKSGLQSAGAATHLQSSTAKVAAPGDILVVEIAGSTYRSWSINLSSTSVQVPQFQAVTGLAQVGSAPTLTVDVTGAKGAYISVVGPNAPSVPVNVVGTMVANGPAQTYPAATPSGFQRLINDQPTNVDDSGLTGTMPDAPMGYLRNDDPQMQGLRGGDPAAMIAFHNASVGVARSLRTQLANENAAFLTTVESKTVTAVQRAQQVQGLAIALARAAGYDGSGNPDFHKIKDFADQLLAHGQADTAAVQQATDQVAQMIPDANLIMRPCLQKANTLLSNGQNLVAALDAEYPDGADGDESAAGDGESKAEKAQVASGPVEQCVIDAEASLPAIDESNAPHPAIAEAAYRQIASDAEAFDTQIESYAAQFETALDADTLEQQLTMSPDTMLGVEREMLTTLKTVDETGEASDELASLSPAGFVDNTSGSAGGQRSLVSSALSKAKSLDKCLIPTIFSFNVLNAGFVIGTPWSDKLKGSEHSDIMIGLGGDDCIKGGGGVDLAFGLSGDDKIEGEEGHDFLFGNKGDDEIEGGDGEEYKFTAGYVTVQIWIGNLISGGAGSDEIFGGTKNVPGLPGYADVILGDGLAKPALAGEDEIDGGGGINFLFGQSGDDKISSKGTGKIAIDGAPIYMGSFMFGGKGDDHFTGSVNMDFAFGSEGNDSGNMGDGFDFAFGGPGDDSMSGGPGFDVLFGNLGNDRLEGGIGPGTGSNPVDAELIFGGPGDDTILDGGTLSAVGGLFFGDTGNDIIRLGWGLNLLAGSPGEDLLVGGRATDLVFGGPDKDTVDGDMGNDLVFGGPDNDRVNGGGGAIDLISGGTQRDIVLGGSDITKVIGLDGTDVAFGNQDSDFVDGQDGIDIAFGDDDSDVVHGGNGPDLVFGNNGNDCVYGDDGPDLLFGGANNDRVWGGNGIDLVVGDAGVDDLWGGSGPNLVISDGEPEKIDLGGGLAIGGDGDDDIYSGGPGIAVGGIGNDKITFSNPGFAIGGAGDDHIKVPDFSISDGGGNKDYISGGMLALGGTEEDEIQDASVELGGAGIDTLMAKGGIGIVFGGDGADQISQASNSAGGVVFGDASNDTIKAPYGHTAVFGNSGDDAIDVYGSASPEPRDFVFGGSGSDTVNRNTSNKKDMRFSASDGSVGAPATPNTSYPLLAAHAIDACPMPSDAANFAKLIRGGVGSPLTLTDDLRDYPDRIGNDK